MIKKEIKKKFRLRGKKLFLTYPQINNNIKLIKECALEYLTTKLPTIREYVIGEEKHEDGKIHLHCFFELTKKIDISDLKYLNLYINNYLFHGNYQIGKNKWNLIEYITKDGNFITNMKLHIKDTKLLTPEEHLYNIYMKEGYHKASKILFNEYPILSIQKKNTLLKNLKKLNEFNIKKETVKVQSKNIFNIQNIQNNYYGNITGIDKKKLNEIENRLNQLYRYLESLQEVKKN